MNEFLHSQDIIDVLKRYNHNRGKIISLMKENKVLDLYHPKLSLEVYNGKNIRQYLKRNLGIEYRAPFDASRTELANNSIDYIVVNTTLQHIPVSDVKKILLECYRILKPGGLIMTTISYLDHYANADKKINYYNMLRFSDDEWKHYNPTLHYQNRLRHSDYMKMFHQLGFSIYLEEPYEIKNEYYKMLGEIPLDDKFNKYDNNDLIILGSYFVLCK